jgi:hypothetical protein
MFRLTLVAALVCGGRWGPQARFPMPVECLRKIPWRSQTVVQANRLQCDLLFRHHNSGQVRHRPSRGHEKRGVFPSASTEEDVH